MPIPSQPAVRALLPLAASCPPSSCLSSCDPAALVYLPFLFCAVATAALFFVLLLRCCRCSRSRCCPACINLLLLLSLPSLPFLSPLLSAAAQQLGSSKPSAGGQRNAVACEAGSGPCPAVRRCRHTNDRTVIAGPCLPAPPAEFVAKSTDGLTFSVGTSSYSSFRDMKCIAAANATHAMAFGAQGRAIRTTGERSLKLDARGATHHRPEWRRRGPMPGPPLRCLNSCR